jgi:hypothetical protein
MRPNRTKEGLRGLRECLPAELIGRDLFNKRPPIESAIHVKQRSPFGNEIRISQIEGAIKVPKVCVPEVLENGNWVTHRSSCRKIEAAIVAMSTGISE